MVKNKIKIPKRNKNPEQMYPLLEMAVKDYSYETPYLIKAKRIIIRRRRRRKGDNKSDCVPSFFKVYMCMIEGGMRDRNLS